MSVGEGIRDHEQGNEQMIDAIQIELEAIVCVEMAVIIGLLTRLI